MEHIEEYNWNDYGVENTNLVIIMLCTNVNNILLQMISGGGIFNENITGVI